MNYFVDVINGQLTHSADRDDAVTSFEKAKREAIQILSQLVRCEVECHEDKTITVLVRDEKDKSLFKAELTMTALADQKDRCDTNQNNKSGRSKNVH